MLSGELDECPLLSGPVWLGNQLIAFEDLACGAAAYFAFLLAEVCGDGFMTPFLPLPDLDYSADCCFMQAMDDMRFPRRVICEAWQLTEKPRPILR